MGWAIRGSKPAGAKKYISSSVTILDFSQLVPEFSAGGKAPRA